MLTTFFAKNRKSEHYGHKSKKQGFSPVRTALFENGHFRNVQNRFVKIQFEKKNHPFSILFIRRPLRLIPIFCMGCNFGGSKIVNFVLFCWFAHNKYGLIPNGYDAISSQ
jgi:hypothetical protein